MVRGKSGRIVIEIDPSLKERLYEALGEEGITLKYWFQTQAESYIGWRVQPSLFDKTVPGRTRSSPKKRKPGE